MTDEFTIEVAGLTVPALGFGTWQLNGEVAEARVADALEIGVRHIDTAQLYANEDAVGRGIAASGVDRDEVFLTTKVARNNAAPADVHRSTEESLRALDVDHVDLLLIHWPAEEIAPTEATLEALTEVRDRGLTRAIGVSNYPSALLRRAFEVAPIVTDQVEHHPYLAVDAIREVLDEHGGFLTAYSPIAKGRIAGDPVLTEIASDHGVTAAQVTLRWLLQRGASAIPRTSSPERVRENADVAGFTLSDDELARIDGLNRGERLVDPGHGVAWDTA